MTLPAELPESGIPGNPGIPGRIPLESADGPLEAAATIPSPIASALAFVANCNMAMGYGHHCAVRDEEGAVERLEASISELPTVQAQAFRLACELLGKYFSYSAKQVGRA